MPLFGSQLYFRAENLKHVIILSICNQVKPHQSDQEPRLPEVRSELRYLSPLSCMLANSITTSLVALLGKRPSCLLISDLKQPHPPTLTLLGLSGELAMTKGREIMQ